MLIKNFGIQHWNTINNKMLLFNKKRNSKTKDEIWLVEHYPIYVYGRKENKNRKKIINNIPVKYSNRGGKITYHGPGQKIIYFLIDIKKKKIKIKKFIKIIIKSTINTLKIFNINNINTKKYSGIFINQKKICSIGLNIKNNYSMHGLALNVSMNLKPFKKITPCGEKKIKMINLNTFNTFNKNKKNKKIHYLLAKKFIYYFNKK